MPFDRLDGAAGEAGKQAERQVGRGQELVEQDLQRTGQALPAILRIAGEAAPARVGEGPVGVGHALGRRDAAVEELAALFVAGPVQRLQNPARELAGFLENADGEIGVDLLVAGQPGHDGVEVEDLAEQEGDVVDRSSIGGHGVSPRNSVAKRLAGLGHVADPREARRRGEKIEEGAPFERRHRVLGRGPDRVGRRAAGQHADQRLAHDAVVRREPAGRALGVEEIAAAPRRRTDRTA